MIKLTPNLLTKAAFAPYGDIIEKDGAKHFPINNGNTERYHDLAHIDVCDGGNGHPIINIFHAQPLNYPLDIHFVERHPLGSQAFIPMGDQPFYLIVAAAGDHVEPANLKAFVTNGMQGINYHKGIWHHPIMAQGQACDFIVIDRGGDGINCDERHFTNINVTFQPA